MGCGTGRVDHALVAGGVEQPSAGAGDAEVLGVVHGPHVVDDQQHPLVGERGAQRLRGVDPRPGVRSHAELRHQVELQGEHVRALADRHPVHAVREPAPDAVVGGQCSGEHRLADPTDPVQAHPGRLAGEADGAAGCGADDGVDQSVQFVAHHVAGWQRGHAGQWAGDVAFGHVGHRRHRPRAAGRSVVRAPRRRRPGRGTGRIRRQAARRRHGQPPEARPPPARSRPAVAVR